MPLFRADAYLTRKLWTAVACRRYAQGQIAGRRIFSDLSRTSSQVESRIKLPYSKFGAFKCKAIYDALHSITLAAFSCFGQSIFEMRLNPSRSHGFSICCTCGNGYFARDTAKRRRITSGLRAAPHSELVAFVARERSRGCAAHIHTLTITEFIPLLNYDGPRSGRWDMTQQSNPCSPWGHLPVFFFNITFALITYYW